MRERVSFWQVAPTVENPLTRRCLEMPPEPEGPKARGLLRKGGLSSWGRDSEGSN